MMDMPVEPGYESTPPPSPCLMPAELELPVSLIIPLTVTGKQDQKVLEVVH